MIESAITKESIRGECAVRTALLEAACDMLAEVGPKSLSVRRLAERAGVNHGQIHHYFGGNIFWYMLDPSGNFFEFFADMDQIADDESWQIRDDWDPAVSWSIWGDPKQPEVFFELNDMKAIIEGWNAAHG